MFILAVGLLAGCDGCDSSTQPTPPPPDAGSALLVANQTGAGNLTVVDIDNQTVRLGAAGLGNIPNDIIRVGEKLYVINSGSGNMNVLRINSENILTSLDTMDLDRGRGLSPQYGAIADNGKMYISNFNDGTVTILDTATGNHVGYTPVGFGPQDVVAVGDKIYVCNSGYDPQTGIRHRPGTVSVISSTNNQEIYSITVGVNPQNMTLDSERNLHVVCSGIQDSVAGAIYKISVRTDAVLQVIYIGGTPGDIALTSQGLAYVAAGGWTTDGFVYLYKTTTGEIINGPQNPILVAKGAMRIISASDGSVYVSCWDGDRVDHIVGSMKQESYVVGDGPAAMTLIER